MRVADISQRAVRPRGCGSLRFDRQMDADRNLTFELGAAQVEGTTTMTGLGRVQQTDSLRPWARFNLSDRRWNVLAYYTGQNSKDIVPLSSGARPPSRSPTW